MYEIKGKICEISGSTVIAKGMVGAGMHTTALVGNDGLLGEVIRIHGDRATLQVYEDTTGLGLDEDVISFGKPLIAELGPGLLSGIFDGIQRHLEALKAASGNFISPGIKRRALDSSRKWDFVPKVKKGDTVSSGDIIGEVQETERIVHRIMVPPGITGTIEDIKEGSYTVDEPVTLLDGGRSISMCQEWPVRRPRPMSGRLNPDTLFVTGQRVFDTLFPVAVGGMAIVPGGFGTGKTVVEQSLAKFSKADIIVYIGCGERGNEMTEVLTDFPKLLDPFTGQPLICRTALVVNTSNMPVAAREASIFTGITIAEYYRDMGYGVALMVDSISRWAEALREISSRLEEMPSEEGYPSYLGARLAAFYERGGRFTCQGSPERTGSMTIISAVSPPAGDLSEPVTQASLRVSGALWALNTDLAYRRHFPAVDWNISFSLYYEGLKGWFAREVSEELPSLKNEAVAVLQKEGELKEIAQLVGIEALQDSDRLTLETGGILREVFLRQNVFSATDAFCPIDKQFRMLKCILSFYTVGLNALKDGLSLDSVLSCPEKASLFRMSEMHVEGFSEWALGYIESLKKRFCL